MIRLSRAVTYVCVVLSCLSCVSEQVSLAQDPHAEKQAKRTRLGSSTVQFYSWFAETVLKLSESGDIDGAGRVARLMEMSWDRDSDKFTDEVWLKVDQASDELVQPAEWGSTLNHNPTHAPDLITIKAAYKGYIAVLKEESEVSK